MAHVSEVIPIGYGAFGHLVAPLMQRERILLVDTRLTPTSRMADWKCGALQRRYRQSYIYLGHLLGNVHHALPGAPIHLADAAAGICELVRLLDEGQNLILLCGCRCYEFCHLHVIVELLRASRSSVNVVFPETIPTHGTIKCLSVQQPWTSLLAHGYKTIENREWSTHYRGQLLLHAGQRCDLDWFDRQGMLKRDLAAHYGLASVMPSRKADYPTGALVGMVDLVDVVTSSTSRWFCGTYGLVFQNARPFVEPIPYAGQLRLFDVPREIVANVETVSRRRGR
jgi:hypothetical protein